MLEKKYSCEYIYFRKVKNNNTYSYILEKKYSCESTADDCWEEPADDCWEPSWEDRIIFLGAPNIECGK